MCVCVRTHTHTHMGAYAGDSGSDQLHLSLARARARARARSRWRTLYGLSFRNAVYKALCNASIEFVTRVDIGINAGVRRLRDGEELEDDKEIELLLAKPLLGNQFDNGAASTMAIIKHAAADLSLHDLSFTIISINDLYLSLLLLIFLLTYELLLDHECETSGM